MHPHVLALMRKLGHNAIIKFKVYIFVYIEGTKSQFTRRVCVVCSVLCATTRWPKCARAICSEFRHIGKARIHTEHRILGGLSGGHKVINLRTHATHEITHTNTYNVYIHIT